jgi:hypothetical protein
MGAVLQSTSSAKEDDIAHQGDPEVFDDVPLCIREFVKLLQKTMGRQDGKERSAQSGETAYYIPEFMKFIQETTEAVSSDLGCHIHAFTSSSLLEELFDGADCHCSGIANWTHFSGCSGPILLR